MSQLLEGLNPQQHAAVELTDGPLLILAGAGSGKTRVITYRIAYLIETGVEPAGILAVTFTNKAADQMKERVRALLTAPLSTWPHISTFHSFCVGVLRRHIEGIGYGRDFSIYDEDDQGRAVKACIGELGLGELGVTPRWALGKISYAKNRGFSPKDLYARAASPAEERLASIFDRYKRRLRQANALDFDDLLLKTDELFRAVPEVLAQYNDRFRYVLVDEFQDTNRIQYQLIRQLTRTHKNLCVVGDEDQSIYRWRGADIQNILSFEKDYPQAEVIRLEQNYRSTQLILDAATAVVECNQARKGKTLWSDRGRGERIGLYEARDAEEEAWFVAGRITEELTENENKTIAVLYRTNAQSRHFEEAMRRAGINYRLVGGFSFYSRAEIKNAIAYVKLALNPRDFAAFQQIVNMPPRGIGGTTMRALESLAREQNLSLWEALEQQMTHPSAAFATRALKALEGFHKIMRQLQQDCRRMSMSEFFRTVLDRTGFLEMLRAEKSAEAQDRIENLQELVNAAAEAEDRGATLEEFLDYASLVSDADQYEERARVTLMTLHSAKGLEFSSVYLAGLEEDVFPHKLSLDDEAGIEEERRLCYVGMTRAKDRLILTWARRRRSFGFEGFEASHPSRFLGEIPSELLEPLGSLFFEPKPRFTWENALNSVESVNQALRHRSGATLRAGGSKARHRSLASSSQRWKLGMRVRHPQYGVGTVLDCEGEGDDAKLTISFPGYGRKKFIERLASLEKV